LLFRVSKMVLIKKTTILNATLLMKTTHGKLISHLCYNRWCLPYDVERKGCCSTDKQNKSLEMKTLFYSLANSYCTPP